MQRNPTKTGFQTKVSAWPTQANFPKVVSMQTVPPTSLLLCELFLWTPVRGEPRMPFWKETPFCGMAAAPTPHEHHVQHACRKPWTTGRGRRGVETVTDRDRDRERQSERQREGECV